MCLTPRVLTVLVRGRVVNRRLRTGLPGNSRSFTFAFSFCVGILILSAWPRSGLTFQLFHFLMCIFRANSCTFRWSGMVLNGFCMVILVLFSSSTSSMCIFRANSRTFHWSGMVLNRFCVVILVFFSSSTCLMCILRANSRTFRWSGMVLNGFCLVVLVLLFATPHQTKQRHLEIRNFLEAHSKKYDIISNTSISKILNHIYIYI